MDHALNQLDDARRQAERALKDYLDLLVATWEAEKGRRP
jgi:hypothetical protein